MTPLNDEDVCPGHSGELEGSKKMTRWYLALAMIGVVGLMLGPGCGESYNTGDDDDTYNEDDDDFSDDDDNVGDDDDNVGDDDDNVGDDDDTFSGTSCNNWDPIDVPGAQWVYSAQYQFYVQDQIQGDFGTETVTTGGSTYFQGYTVYQRLGSFQGQQYAVDWYGYNNCGAGGNVDYGSNVPDMGGQGAVLTINSPEVMYLPYDPDQAAGDSWTSTYTQMVDSSQGSGSWPANWNWSVVGMESVTVPAGTFNAVHIHADYTTGDPIGDNHVGTLDTYWVEGIGLIKWDEQRSTWPQIPQYILRELQSYSGL